MPTFFCTLFIFAIATVVQAGPPTADGRPQLQLWWGSGPVRWRAKSLFDPALQLTQDQQKLLARIDAIELRALSVNYLRPSEVVAAIRGCLADAKISDIVIRVDPSLHTSSAFVSFSQRDMRLANALKSLMGLGDISYTLSGNEIVVGRSLNPRK